MPASVPATGPSGALNQRRLRAALRLILPATRADSAAARIADSDDQLSALRDVAVDLARERRLARMTARLRKRSAAPGSSTPRQLPDDVSIQAALALLLHVCLDVESERLEDAFGLDTEDIGLDLLRARAAYTERPIVACHEFIWLVGLYRDRCLDADQRVRLLSHARNCGQCLAALDQAQHADATLLASYERTLESLPSRPVEPRRNRANRRFGASVIAIGSAAALIALLAGIVALGRLLSPPDAPVSLFAGVSVSPTTLDGWLLQTSPVGYLEGINLASGQRRGLDSGNVGGNLTPVYRVSRTHIAAWRPSDGQHDDVLTIGPIGEPVAVRLTWNRRDFHIYPSGWLDDDTLLVVKTPEHIAGETELRFLDRLTSESRLIALDAATGAEQVLMTGNVAAAYPSPDRTMLAILRPIDRRWPGKSLELRSFDGESVGEAVAVIEHRVVGDGFWLPDSSRFIASVIVDPAIEEHPSSTSTSLAERGVEQVELQGIARDGGTLTFVTASVPDTIVPLGASPDGRSIVYQVREPRTEERSTGVPAYDWSCYQLVVADGEPVLLTEGDSPERIFQPTWSPDGGTLILPIARAFPLSTDGQIDQPANPNATTLLVFDAHWRPGTEPRAIYSSGRDLHGWLPPGALEPRPDPESGDTRALAAMETPGQEFDTLGISAESVAGREGLYLVAEDRTSRSPVIWNVAGNRLRRLVEYTTDLSWFNQGSVTIGVETDRDGVGSSRIVLNVADISNSAAYLDQRHFDPAGLGESASRRYALPLVSPAGTAVSYFVVDRDAGSVALWLDLGAGPASVVAEWQLPANRLVDPALVAVWARPDTLLLARPDDWRDGKPREVVLARVFIEPGGRVRIDELTRLDTAFGAEGLLLAELELSPDATQLAYRLRHCASAALNSTSDDTLHVADTDDLGHAIELERGGFGEGLAWTVHGTGLAAGVRGRIALYSPDGRDLEYLSPRSVDASHPVRIGEQIWFSVVEAGAATIWRVDLGQSAS